MKIISNQEEMVQEFENLVNLFDENCELEIKHTFEEKDDKITEQFIIQSGEKQKSHSFTYQLNEKDPLRRKSKRKRKSKIFLYDILSSYYKKTLPWGSLTGIRPTKLARDTIKSGEVKENVISEVLEKEYKLSKNRAKLIPMILKNQKCIIRNDNLVDLYINIPICPSRCLYCSFISSELKRVKDKVDSYVDCLIKELNAVREIINKKAYIVRTIYIGGGTPSVLTASQLDKLLSAIKYPINEFTVECGRPDTITEEKLDTLKKHNVTRISINPQTFCEATLKRIGRNHKNSQVLKGYQMALERGFIVNMDIIAGLPGEKLGVFKRTINTLLDLNPENLTIHTLSIKNGALLKNENFKTDEDVVCRMIDYAQKVVLDKGYKPYYLYRQKHQLSGLENVGYYRDEHVCIFNIDSMEETNTVIACGAGAMSKRVFNNEKRIERLSNPKFIEDYITRLDEIIAKKKDFFS